MAAASLPGSAATSTVAAAALAAALEQGDERGAATDRPWWHVRQASVGSTSIRPFISMCMAWQNHWQ